MLRSRMTNIFLLGLLVLAGLYSLKTPLKEPLVDQAQNVVCLMCVCPNEIVINFAKKISALYKVYIICDDIYCHTPTDPSLTFLKISDDECAKLGYTKSNVAIGKIPSAWDKALYYFCVKDTKPENVWFIEEDVFIPRASILPELDVRYPHADLIAKENVKQQDDPDFGWWFDAEDLMQPPLYRSMVCAARLSRKLLNRITDFVRLKGRLVFIEIMFNTIVVQQNMELATPGELSTIIWRHDWTPDIIDENHMYHPIKDMRRQKDYREVLKKNPGSKIEAFVQGSNRTT